MTENELLLELARELCPPEIEDGEVTTEMLQDATGLSYKGAYDALERKVRKNILKWRWIAGPNGNKRKAYSKV
jgi:hypothetical protein